MGIITELKERRLVQIVLSYLAAGWVFLEVVDQFVDNSILPGVAYYVVLIWFLVGIPAAFLIGWHHGEKGKQKAPRSEVAILVVLALSALGFSGFTVVQLNTPEVDLADFGLDPNRVAVMYFEDLSPGERNQHIANGLTDALIAQLSEVAALDVVSRNGVAPFQGSGAPRDSIAQVLAAGTLVGGTVEPVGDRIRVDLQLYDGVSGAPLPDGRVSLQPRPADSLALVMDEMGEEAGQLLRRKLGDHVQISRRAAETNMTAWTLAQRGERLRRQGEALAADGDLEAGFARFDEAHEILAEAQRADTLWARPTVLRSQIEYRKSRLTPSHQLETGRYIDRGLALADSALDIDPANADALASRGSLRYWKYALNLVPDELEKQRTVDQAREDLERAVRLDPSLAGAHSMLSALYFRTESLTRGILAAQRAYDADAYLESADDILWRLYAGNYDLENWTEARKWCEIAVERFPEDPGFINCPLNLMIAGAMEPDPDRAWELAARVEETADPGSREFERLLAEMTVGGVLARGGLQDSATAVLDRASARINPDVDVANDLRWSEAQMRVLNGQEDEAIDILARIIAADPHHAFGVGAEVGWAWRPLLDHPRFHELQREDAGHH
jgi:TolB-like protein